MQTHDATTARDGIPFRDLTPAQQASARARFLGAGPEDGRAYTLNRAGSILSRRPSALSIDDVVLTTNATAALCGMTEAALAKYRRHGLTPDVSRGQGLPAEYRMVHILRVWLLAQLLKVWVRLEDAIPVANHADVLGALISGEPVRVFFPGGVPKMSGDPQRDPVLSIPCAFIREMAEAIAAKVAAEGRELLHRGSDAAGGAHHARSGEHARP